MVTSTFGGTLTGLLPMRDMLYPPSRHDAQDFATDTGCARLAIGHDAMRSRNDRDTQTVHHPRNVVLALVDAQTRLAHAFDLLDHGTSGVVLQSDFQLRLDFLADHRE